MKRDLQDILIIVSVFPVLAYLISGWFIWRKRPIHNSILALWLLGFIYSIVTICAAILISNPKLYTTVGGIFLIFIAESCSGIQHWLFAVEYYFSSLLI